MNQSFVLFVQMKMVIQFIKVFLKETKRLIWKRNNTLMVIFLLSKYWKNKFISMHFLVQSKSIDCCR